MDTHTQQQQQQQADKQFWGEENFLQQVSCPLTFPDAETKEEKLGLVLLTLTLSMKLSTEENICSNTMVCNAFGHRCF